MKYQVAYSNVYGNAKILADAIMDMLPPDSVEYVDLSCQELYDDADIYLIVFEMMRNAIPLDIMDALENLGGKSILYFGFHTAIPPGASRERTGQGCTGRLPPFGGASRCGGH